MPTVDANIVKGFPHCPVCKFKYEEGSADDYGSDGERGFWFMFICPVCSKKVGRKTVPKTKVKYYADNDFNLIKGATV